MMKKFRIVFLLVIAFLIGYIHTAFVYNGFWHQVGLGLRTIPIWMYFIWFIMTFFITLIIHELGHFIAFSVQGVKLRALYIFIFVLYKDQKGWHVTIKPKLWVLIGGLVVPDLGEIKDEAAYEKINKKFANALIAAPIVTIVFAVLMFLFAMLMIIFSTQYTLSGIIILTSLYTLILTIVYVYSFTLSNQMFYGDFVAYKKMKTDPIFQLAQLTQYTMFSLSDLEDTDRFLWCKIRDTLQKTHIKQGLFHMMLIMYYIEGLLKYDLEVDPQVHIKLSRLQVHSYMRSEHGVMLTYDLAHYFYKVGQVEKAYMLFDYIQDRASQKIDEEALDYLKKRSMHIMHIEDQSAFIKTLNGQKVGQAWMFDVLMDLDVMMSENFEKLPFQTYVCEVELKMDEEKEGE